MTSTTLAQRIERFDAYFRSANGVPPNARISVPTAEWQELRAALMPQCLHQIAEPAAPQAAGAAQAVEPVRYPDLPASAGDVVDFQDGRGVDIDWASPAPPGGTSLYSADQMRAYVDADRAARAPQAAATQAAIPWRGEPTALIQLANLLDSGRSLIHVERKDAADALRILAATPAAQEGQDARDAERYRWLRSRDLETIGQGGVFAGLTPQNVILNENDLDEAVDAAIAAQAAQGGA